MTDLFAQLAALDCAATVIVGDNLCASVFRHELAERLGYERASTVTVLVIEPSDLSKLRGRPGPAFIHPAMPYNMTVASACHLINEAPRLNGHDQGELFGTFPSGRDDAQ